MNLVFLNKYTVFRGVGNTVLCLILGVLSFSALANDIDKPESRDVPVSPSHAQIYRSALDGSAAAQYEVGLVFEYGRGVDANDAVAAYWYELSAVQHNVDASYRLGVLCDNGWGKTVNKPMALKYYRTAAEGGHELAQHDLAILYFQGTAGTKSLLQAYKWMKIAVSSGNPLMQKHLKLISAEMTASDIELAESLVAEWLKQTGA